MERFQGYTPNDYNHFLNFSKLFKWLQQCSHKDWALELHFEFQKGISKQSFCLKN